MACPERKKTRGKLELELFWRGRRGGGNNWRPVSSRWERFHVCLERRWLLTFQPQSRFSFVEFVSAAFRFVPSGSSSWKSVGTSSQNSSWYCGTDWHWRWRNFWIPCHRWLGVPKWTECHCAIWGPIAARQCRFWQVSLEPLCWTEQLMIRVGNTPLTASEFLFFFFCQPPSH